jgi:acetylornithine deacetylase/succinyl-diaminopimelate desuccinylase-like protein
MMKKQIILLLFVPIFSFGQMKNELDEISKKYTLKSFNLLKDILSIPNDAFYPEWIEKNISWTEKAFSKRGFITTRIKTKGAPLLLASQNFNSSGQTVLIYLQMDGQPVDPNRWNQKDPYLPVLKKQNINGDWESISWNKINNYDSDWRVFARSASDAKGPVAMFLTAMDAVNDLKKLPNYNIKVILDFEEEMGSPNLPEAVKNNTDLLKADQLIIFDGPLHRLNKPTLEFGARGIATMQLTTYGPIVPQHSGHFGNYVPNPAFKLSRILASMKSENGKVIIPGFYNGIVLTDEIKSILNDTPHNEEELKNILQFSETDKVADNYQESIQYPSLNIRGMQSGWINEKVRTIIPAWARAEIDIRLVKESSPENLIKLIKSHIENQGYLILDREPTKKERIKHPNIATIKTKILYQSFRTDMQSKIGRWLQKALVRAFDQDPIIIRMSGGSIPISPFVNSLGIPAVCVPTVNIDNNQHSPNENLRLGNYRDGIKTILTILTEPLD